MRANERPPIPDQGKGGHKQKQKFYRVNVSKPRYEFPPSIPKKYDAEIYKKLARQFAGSPIGYLSSERLAFLVEEGGES